MLLPVTLAIAAMIGLGEPPAAAPAPVPAPVPAVAKHVDAIVYSTRGDNKVHLLRATDLMPIESIDVGVGVHETAISSDGRWLMGSAYGGPGAGHQPADKRVVIVDLKTRKLHQTISLDDMQRPNDIKFIADSSRAVVTVEMPPSLVVIDAQSGEKRAIKIDRQANHMVALNPAGTIAYVAHVVPGSLSVVDLASGNVGSSIPLPPGAEGIAASPNGTRVWVASNRSGKISIIDTDKSEIIQTVDCAGFPFRVRYSPAGESVAVSCPSIGEVAIYNAIDPAQVHRISILAPDAEKKLVPTALAFVGGDERLAVLCEGENAEIVLVDVPNRRVLSRVAAKGTIADALSAGRIQSPNP